MRERERDEGQIYSRRAKTSPIPTPPLIGGAKNILLHNNVQMFQKKKKFRVIKAIIPSTLKKLVCACYDDLRNYRVCKDSFGYIGISKSRHLVFIFIIKL